jgi:type II secretory ATPase GspE/PulE/Tfp pilus assembly ATPase PilB-like protein
MQEIGITQEDLRDHPLMAGAGCPECRGVGFRGRSGVYEMITVDDQIRQMIVKQESATVIKQYGMRAQEMRTLLMDGRQRVLNGDTTIKEVLRVCQREGFE